MGVTSVGASLRAERLRQNVTLADLALRTRISQKFLTDIEQENFDALPGIIFARNFIRSYATELGMDPDPLVAELPRVDLTQTPMPNPPEREKPSSWDPRWNSAFASLAWTLLAVGAATAAYIHFNHPAGVAPRPVATAPIKAAPVHPAPPVQQPAAPAAAAVIDPSPAHPVNVVVTAKEAAWVQITSDGKNAFTGILQPGESRDIAADDAVKLLTGNAAGVTIKLNGKELDALGPEGQVRTVRLTAEGPQLVLKTPPPQPQPPSDPL